MWFKFKWQVKNILKIYLTGAFINKKQIRKQQQSLKKKIPKALFFANIILLSFDAVSVPQALITIAVQSGPNQISPS